MPAADRNLLFGILALQLDFINRDQLIAGMHAWVLAKERPLGDIVVEQKSLDPARRQLLDALVAEHLKQHDGDPQKSLAAVSSIKSVRQDLEALGDADVQASLAPLSSEGRGAGGEGRAAQLSRVGGTHPSRAAQEPKDEYATTASVGEPSSIGSRFRILRPHAKGGLGEVYLARDEELNREVALKEIQLRHAGRAEYKARFLLEAEITGGLEHPGIVPVYGLGHYADGRPFYAMRFIRGDSLQEAIARFHKPTTDHTDNTDKKSHASCPSVPSVKSVVEFSGFEFRKLLGRFVDVCQAIAYAHSRGVLHRDLKPGNIMLGKYGETLVVDWGLAKASGAMSGTRGEQAGTGEPGASATGGDAEPPLKPTSSGSAETVAGSALGTPQFMSPEQAEGRLDLLGPASDVYSLGATLYCLLTGQAPFTDKDTGEVLRKVTRGDFPRPRHLSPAIPPGLEAICLKAISLQREARYPSARDLADDVEHWLADEPVSAWPEPWTVKMRRWVGRHRVLVSGAAAALLVGVVGLSLGLVFLGEANETIRHREADTRKANASLESANKDLDQARDEAVGLAKKEGEARGRAEGLAAKEAEARKNAEELADQEKKARAKTEEALAGANYWRAQRDWKLGNLEGALDSLLAISCVTGNGTTPGTRSRGAN